MKPTQEFLNQAHEFARHTYLNQQDGQKLYDFAIKLVKQCNIIGGQAGISKEDLVAAHLSALFLYTGFNISPAESEWKGFEKANEFLRLKQVDIDFVEAIKDCMDSVKPPQTPIGNAGQVLCDALNSLLVAKNKKNSDEILLLIPGHTHLVETKGKNPGMITHLEQIVFFTNPAKKAFDKLLQRKIESIKHAGLEVNSSDKANENGLKDAKTGNLIEPKPDRGAATLFRNASREHIAMLSIVHQKSGFLLSFNSILLSVVLSILSTKLGDFPHLLMPTVLLVVTCLGTIIFTILATRPMIIRNRKDPLARDTFNAMFFGHYVHLNWQEYSEQIKNITTNVDSMVEVLSKNIYYQGVVLDKKYRLLSIAYKIFLVGLVISVSGFVISFFR